MFVNRYAFRTHAAYDPVAAMRFALEHQNPLVAGNDVLGAVAVVHVEVDECYALVGLIRTRWRGFSGGREVWDDITRFFEELGSRAKTVTVG